MEKGFGYTLMWWVIYSCLGLFYGFFLYMVVEGFLQLYSSFVLSHLLSEVLYLCVVSV